MTQWIDEGVFITALTARLKGFHKKYAAVTGPGRSGAIAAAFASYISGRPFVPYGQPHPGPILIVDTATMSGRTLRKARNRYKRMGIEAHVLPVYRSPVTRYHFWYEKPVDKSGGKVIFDYSWSPFAAEFWMKLFPYHGVPPKPSTGCGCLVWIIAFLICAPVACSLL